MNVMEVFNDSQAEVRRLSPLFAPGSMTPARARFWRHDVGRLMLLDFMHRKFDEILVRSRRARPAQVLGIGTPNGCSILRHELRAISHDFHKRGFPYAGDFLISPSVMNKRRSGASIPKLARVSTVRLDSPRPWNMLPFDSRPLNMFLFDSSRATAEAARIIALLCPSLGSFTTRFLCLGLKEGAATRLRRVPRIIQLACDAIS